MTAAAANTSPTYAVGSTTLTTPGHIVLTGATATSAPAPALTPQQIAQQAQSFDQNLPLFGGIAQILEGITPGGQAIGSAGAQLGAQGDLNPLDIAGVAVSNFAAGVSGDIVSAFGQAILGVLTTIGHGLANALVTFLQWAGGLAKGHIIALAVAAVVLYLVFRP